MSRTIGILIFDGVEEMDFVGPWEVFTAAVDDVPGERVITIAERPEPVVCEKGMRVIPDVTFPEARDVDVVLVPGGSGARREIANCATTDWLRKVAAECTWLTSVCTGAFLLVGAGLTLGRRITTHHDFLDELRAMGAADVVEGARFVRDGKLVTTGGVMSGIEMSLWLTERLYGADIAARTRRYIAYDFPPRNRIEER
jgi:transcriptional regulator GlxA family with amidase domain